MGDICACPAGYDAPLPSLHNAKFRRAKKEYRCCECGETIAQGDRYEYVWGVWEGDQQTYRTCATCHAIREGLFCNGSTYTWMKTELREFVQECFDDLPWDAIRALPDKATRKNAGGI